MGLFDFIGRHKKKFLFVGGAVGTVVVINKILANYEKQWQTSSSRTFVHEVRKKEIHFENIINECNQLCQRSAPKIVARLEESLDDSHLIEALNSKRKSANVQDKVEIWKELKVRILTRLLTEIYSNCLFVCFVRVQMSVVGGQVFAHNATQDSGSSSSASVAELANMKAYMKYVAILGSFYDRKLDVLIQPIEQTVEETLKDYSIDYKISIQDFKAILEKIKRSLSFILYSQSSETKDFFTDIQALTNDELSSALPTSSSLAEEDKQKIRELLAETRDIFESDDFREVLGASIEVGYSLLLDTLLGAFIKMDNKLNNTEEKSSFLNPNALQVPLVKILPQIRKNHLKRTEAEQRSLVNHLLRLDVLNCFAANVYEAFCMPKNCNSNSFR